MHVPPREWGGLERFALAECLACGSTAGGPGCSVRCAATTASVYDTVASLLVRDSEGRTNISVSYGGPWTPRVSYAGLVLLRHVELPGDSVGILERHVQLAECLIELDTRVLDSRIR